MKINRNIAIAFMVVFYLCAPGIAQNLKLENIKRLQTGNLFVTKPVWSPDGRQILLTGQNNRGIYIFDTTKNSVEPFDKNIRIKGKPYWLSGGEIAYSKGNKLVYIDRFKSTGYGSKGVLLVLNPQRQKVEAIGEPGTARIDVTPEKGLYYNPVISPDGKSAVIHKGSEMYLYATDGSGKIRRLGTGIAASWSADSRFIFYFLDTSIDGHEISNSELYVVDICGTDRQRLTYTEDVTEMWPDVAPDGKTIAYADEKTGSIFIARLRPEQE